MTPPNPEGTGRKYGLDLAAAKRLAKRLKLSLTNLPYSDANDISFHCFPEDVLKLWRELVRIEAASFHLSTGTNTLTLGEKP